VLNYLPITNRLGLVSDVILALAFEPILWLLVFLGGKVPFLARLRVAMREVRARTATQASGTSAGPVTLVLIAFGVDPPRL